LAALQNRQNEVINAVNIVSPQKENSEVALSTDNNTINENNEPSLILQLHEENEAQEPLNKQNGDITETSITNKRQLEIERLKKIPKQPNKIRIREYENYSVITNFLHHYLPHHLLIPFPSLSLFHKVL
jgi:hypothetical protein